MENRKGHMIVAEPRVRRIVNKKKKNSKRIKKNHLKQGNKFTKTQELPGYRL